MEDIKRLIDTIRKPFLFIHKSSYEKLSSVKELGKRTISLAEQGLSLTNEVKKRDSLKELITIFQGYESLDENKRKEAVERAILILDDLSGTKTMAMTKETFFEEAKHKISSIEKYKEFEEKLSSRVQYLKGVGPKIAAKFENSGIHTIGDILYFFPRRYEDRRKMKKIEELREDESSTFMAEIKDIHTVYYRGQRKGVLQILIADETGELTVKWFHFNEAYFKGRIRIGQKVVFTGKIRIYKGKAEMLHPEFESLGKTAEDSLSFGRVVPVYSEIGGLYQKTLRKIMFNAVKNFMQYKLCPLPPDICKQYDLMSPEEALKEIHYPDKYADILLAEEDLSKTPLYRSIIFQELFLFNLLIGLKKRSIKIKQSVPIKVEDNIIEKFMSLLPFKMTKAQLKVVDEIRKDISLTKPMNRLLEGDVGSGKTIVAFLAAFMSTHEGFQVAFMAPTEILAEQVYSQAEKLFSKLGYKVEFLIGALDDKKRKKILKDLKAGSIDLVIGTHALIQKGVEFKNLGLVIVDEQHRFGVMQRGALREKGEFPHVLIMTATPIPRTLALTYYGDLDISTIKEMPKGRKPIDTKLVTDQSRKKLYDFVKAEIKKGRQAYIIYPIIEESEKMNLLDATRMSKYLSENIFKDYRCALIHGRLANDEKESIMGRFRKGKIDVLVSTTVIEVGIDVPNSTIMIIEHPERFGLSQLHQLRGRVGRGAHKSYCFLLLGIDYGDEIKERLTIFKGTQDGFKLAEEDLRLRGPGDFFGVTQSGLPTFVVAQFPRDIDLLKITREEAFSLLEKDYHLKNKENSILPLLIKKYWGDKVDLLQVG